MMKRLISALLLGFACVVTVPAGEIYQVQIDLASLNQDRLTVAVNVPHLDQDTAVFVFPVTVPGTYEPHDWWRLVSNFKAFDTAGVEIPVRRSLDSQFVIPRASELDMVLYEIDDSFDDLDERYRIFQPTGTSFQADGIFVFNHGGVIGYIEGHQHTPFSVTVHRPKELYCSTALNVVSRRTYRDTYVAETYDALVDGPAVFCRPDTASFDIHGVNVQVAMVHRRDTLVAAAYAKRLQEVTEAIGVFLPSMPVDRYAFLIYLWDGDTVEVKRAGFAQGALEHNYSSLYFWRYASKPFGLDGVAAHEFLHILVPLNVHSREIDEFNFRAPEMSAHLWLYEGVTEYFADQALLRGGLTKEGRYIRGIKSQARFLNRAPDTFALCDFSRNVLNDQNQRLYPLIYQIGPLNALIMDIQLREISKGETGLLDLVYQLMARYGPRNPFEDDDLFAVIGDLAGSKIEAYCRRHLEEGVPYPFAEYLPKIGLTYQDSSMVDRLSYGIGFSHETDNLDHIILEPEDDNPLGIRKGDVALMVDGEEINEHSNRIMRRIFNPKKATEITLTVERDGQDIELTGSPTTVQRVVRHVIGEVEEPTHAQLRMRNLVFYGDERGATGSTSRSAKP